MFLADNVSVHDVCVEVVDLRQLCGSCPCIALNVSYDAFTQTHTHNTHAQVDEEGNPVLDEDGNPVKKPKKEKKEKPPPPPEPAEDPYEFKQRDVAFITLKELPKEVRLLVVNC